MSARNLIAMLTVLSVVCCAAIADPIIVVGDHLLQADTLGQLIQIFIVPDDPALATRGVNFYAQVGDGGPELENFSLPAGTDAPAITEVNLKPVNGIFAGLSGDQYDLGSIDQVAMWSYVFTGDESSVPLADGLLATITIDTTGFTEGTWALQLANVLDLPTLGGPFDTDLAGQTLQITNGTITIPEPATLTLLTLGLAVLTRRQSTWAI